MAGSDECECEGTPKTYVFIGDVSGNPPSYLVESIDGRGEQTLC